MNNEYKDLAHEMGVDDATFEEIKIELDNMQANGTAPQWYKSIGWQTIRGDYIWREGGETNIRQAFIRIAKAAASYLPSHMKYYEQKFFDILWNGWLIPSSPVFANMGTGMGMSVSCSGTYIQDDLESIYDVLKENAMLSKYGFGTSADFGDLRSRGNNILGTGGKSGGLVAWMKQYKQMIEEVTQGKKRRGAFAGYINIDHDDFDEVMEWFKNNHDKFSLGLNISDSFTNRCINGDMEALRRRAKALELRRVIGSPYFFYIDKANRAQPDSMKNLGLTIKASNLCTEITLPSGDDFSFSCVLSSMNAISYDEWKDTDAVETAIVFLDCVAEDLIVRGGKVKGLEKVVEFTKRARALGLGLLGFHSYLQEKMVAFESLEANYINTLMFKNIQSKAMRASEMLAKELGSPEWCMGGVRNSHLLAIAPNTTSAHLAGSLSQGIEPWVGNYFVQPSSKGTLLRINPHFIKLLKSKGKYDKVVLESVRDANGSCQHLDFLDENEKAVFRTAYEMDQMVLLRMANSRQRYICQGQSLNLFFPKIGDEWTQEQIEQLYQYMDDCHSYAEQSSNIKALYYVRSQAGIAADTGKSCLACEG